MDLIDQASYGEYNVDAELARAYREVFSDSEAGRKVMKDILRHSNWGMESPDSNVQCQIHHRSAIVHHLKKMLNGIPVEREEESEDELN